VVAALLANGCSKQADKAATPGGRVAVGILSEPKSLNPLIATSAQTQDILGLIFVKLAQEQADFLSLEPRLAQSWSFGTDSLTITFNLRDDVRWHDGVPVTAADVRFTWQLQVDPEVGWAGRRIKDRIADVEIVDEFTVRMHFSERYLHQLQDAADGWILPKHLLEGTPAASLAEAPFSRQPVGAGPYQFARWAQGQFVELERNPAFYNEGQPLLESVTFRIVPDMTNLVTQLKTGEIDCLESIPFDALREIHETYPDIKIHRYPSRGMTFVVWNLEDELFADRQMRRALAMAINTPEIIATLWGDLAAVSDSPMHPSLWAHDRSIEPIAFDPEGATAALASLGWTDTDKDGVLDKDGVPFEFEMTTNQGVQVRADVLAMVQEYLRKVGIKVNARVLEFNTFIQGVVKGEFQSCVLGWKVETRADLTNFWHSEAVPPNGFNACRYNNPEVDALIERAKSTLDVETAKELWFQCQRQIYEDQPILFVAVPYEVVGLRDKYCNVRPNVHGFFVNLHEWYTGEDCGR
jgi:peptide/nickel transport system substrate-binding protein